ncbi:MAG TPA: hypothetical protein VF017_17165 [Thermoanaerobaculia bacterium]|nr:hypothetical protein [Thermoanaerobaculia bacterium]
MSSEAYESSLDAALSWARERARQLALEPEADERTLTSLSGAPPLRRALVLANRVRGRGWRLCDQLLGLSEESRSESPDRAVAAAQVAFEVAERLEDGWYGPRLVADVRARAAAELADTRRLAGRPEEALGAMRSALDHLQHGTGDPLLAGRVFEISAELLADRGRPELASELLERASRLYLALGEGRAAGRVCYRRALLVEASREPLVRLDGLLQALELLDPQEDRDLAWRAIQELITLVVELGWLELGRELIEEVRSLPAEATDPEDLARMDELEERMARVRRRSGRLGRVLPWAVAERSGVGNVVAFALARTMPKRRRRGRAARARA